MSPDRPRYRGRLYAAPLVLLAFAVLIAAGLTLCARQARAAEACSGCGCKGGPGYRAASGRCVSWKTLDKVCGTPRTTRCTAEQVHARPERRGQTPRPRAPRVPPTHPTVPNPF